ncbi:MAG: hypothetical protein GYB68_19750, partial [Chloroflexi bacterium]|nr:hypothetical protein [Chloroflexota bacterium]
MNPVGAFTFVLHSHLPYARMAGRWPHGEEWIHEAASETYIPLLNALYDLKAEGVQFKLTVGLTPVLVEQLADADVLTNFVLYLEEKIEAAKKDIKRFQGSGDDEEVVEEPPAESGEEPTTTNDSLPPSETDLHMAYLAEWYLNWFEMIKNSFESRYNR